MSSQRVKLLVSLQQVMRAPNHQVDRKLRPDRGPYFMGTIDGATAIFHDNQQVHVGPLAGCILRMGAEQDDPLRRKKSADTLCEDLDVVVSNHHKNHYTLCRG